MRSVTIFILCCALSQFSLAADLVHSKDAETSTYQVSTVTDALKTLEDGVIHGDRLKIELAERFLSQHFEDALKDPHIVDLETFAFVSLLSRPWPTNETFALNAALKWIEHNKAKISESVKSSILNHIYLDALTLEELSVKVYRSGLFDRDAILDSFIQKTSSHDINPHLRFPNQLALSNVVSAPIGARVEGVTCEPGFVLGERLNKTCVGVRSEILITLGATFTIDTIKASQRTSGANFAVYVSEDKVNWTFVHDFYFQEETWRFEEQAVHYIKFVKLGNANKFEFSNIHAFHETRFRHRILTTELDYETEAEEAEIQDSAYSFNNVGEALATYNEALLENDHTHLQLAERYLSSNFDTALRASSLTDLDAFALASLISKTWITSEIEVLNAVYRWLQVNSQNVTVSQRRTLTNHVHLCALTLGQLSAVAQKITLFTRNEYLEAFVLKTDPSQDLRPLMRYANQLASDNVATKKMLASLEGGECTPEFELGTLNENESCESDDEIVITLGTSFLLNRVEVHTLGGTGIDIFVYDTRTRWNLVGFQSGAHRKFAFSDSFIRYIKIKKDSTSANFELLGISAYYEK